MNNLRIIYSKWKWPNIEGIQDFKGKLIHSARWDQDYDFSGKKVANIGIGSSGVQIIPQLAKVVDSLDVYIRTQTWISPAPGINEPTANDPEMDTEYNFSESTLEMFKDPKVLRDYRAAIMDRRSNNFKRAIADSDLQKRTQEVFRKSMTERLGDSPKGQKAAQYLLPEFPVGCRRLTPGPGFLEALTQDNVELRWDDVARITEKGIMTRSGEEKEYDVIVCATGFDTSFRPSFPLIGRNGVNLAHKWDAAPGLFRVSGTGHAELFLLHRAEQHHQQRFARAGHPSHGRVRVQMAGEVADGDDPQLRGATRRERRV